ESERGIRETFRKAKQAAPSIIFFDEIDAIAPRRGSGYGDSHVTERVISQLLTEMDGLEELRNVTVIAATNRPDILDPALLRPGRFDRLIYVKPPDKKARIEILKVHLRGKPLSEDVKIEELAEKTEDYVGADLEAVCREAAMLAMREYLKTNAGKEEKPNFKISIKHFEEALKKVKPTGKSTLERYEEWAKKFESLYI
ncbi:MAG: AAA family ATPase, partial [Candidatus Bathyarchaeia archaeon]